MPRKVAPRRVQKLQRKFLRQQGATPEEIRRYLPYLTAQIGAESAFIEGGAHSSAGAQDISQFMPGTAKSYGVTLGDNKIKDDIRGQIKYMLPLLRKYGVEGALRGYNAGPGAIEASKGYGQTNAYVDRIKSTAGQYRGLVSAGGGGGAPGRAAQYGTIPGTDNSAVRQQLLINYLAERGQPGALANLGLGLKDAQDTPSRRVQTRGSRPGSDGRPSEDGIHVKGKLYELIWRGPGAETVKNGQEVPTGFYSGHTDHVHVAARQKMLVKLGRLAQRHGLTVRENPAFDPVDPVHVSGSYHYGKKVGKRMIRAIDVSGDPSKMSAYAAEVARLYGV